MNDAAKAEAKRIALIYIERSRNDDDERAAIERQAGVRSTAQVVGVRKVAELAPDPTLADIEGVHPPQELAVHVNVRAVDGAAFGAEVPLFLDEIVPPPAVGEVLHVIYHPTDRSRVRFVAQWRGPTGAHGVRWIVPARCPSCGAPVDQSSAVYDPHPTCASCRAPLPVQPAS